MENKPMTKKKIKTAFVKFGGAAHGGTEMFLQNLAAWLPKDEFEVDYYYCDAAPYIGSDWKHPDTDPERVKFLEENGVNAIKFNVGFKDVTQSHHPWVDTNFFEVFDEAKYDLIQTARAGHPEYPFTEIKNTPIVDSIHLSGMVDNQENIKKVIHINHQNAEIWVKSGGNRNRVEVIYPPIKPPNKDNAGSNLRKELGLSDDVFVYGMHQRNDPGIFSEWPLAAYSKIEEIYGEDKAVFVLLGGSEKHKEQARKLGRGQFHILDSTNDPERIWSFLRTLDVYLHGRRDGEVNSQAIAEAMACGLPVVSHVSMHNNGHIETIGNAGAVTDKFDKYVQAAAALYVNVPLRKELSENASKRFEELYDSSVNIEKLKNIYKAIAKENEIDSKGDEDFWGDMW